MKNGYDNDPACPPPEGEASDGLTAAEAERDYNRPLFTIGITADLLGVSQATLRIWERKGLIVPSRLGKNRYYSRQDIDRLREIKALLQEERMNIAGVKAVLKRIRCWEEKRCGPRRFRCVVYRKIFGKKGKK